MEKQNQGKKMGQIFVKAWDDDAFKHRLMADASAVLKEEGIELPPGVEVRVVENTEQVFHLVLPKKPTAEELTDEQLDSISGGEKCFIGDCNFGFVWWCMMVGEV